MRSARSMRQAAFATRAAISDCSTPSGANSATSAASKSRNAARSSPASRTNFLARRPCFRALRARRELARRGPGPSRHRPVAAAGFGPRAGRPFLAHALDPVAERRMPAADRAALQDSVAVSRNIFNHGRAAEPGDLLRHAQRKSPRTRRRVGRCSEQRSRTPAQLVRGLGPVCRGSLALTVCQHLSVRLPRMVWWESVAAPKETAGAYHSPGA